MKSIFTILFTMLVLVSYGQQDPLYAQYINNPFVINPAYSGFDNNLNLNVSYRQQWSGMEGSPETLNFSGHTTLKNNGMAIGMIVVSDRIGSSSTTEAMLTYSYRINLNSKGTKLSFGLQGGMSKFQATNNDVTIKDPSDPLFQGKLNETTPTIGAGLLVSSNRFFIGLSVPRMLKSTVETKGLNQDLYSQHYYLVGAWLKPVSERVTFKPSVLIKYVSGSPVSADVNASVILDGKFQAGLMTRNLNTYGALLQLMMKETFRLGYVFEVPVNDAIETRFNTHEITLGLRLQAFSFHDKSSILTF